MTYWSLALAFLLWQQTPTGAPESGLSASQTALQQETVGNYTLGPGDQLEIFVLDLPELDNRQVTVDLKGGINLPTVGRLVAAGRTTDQIEAEIETKLKKYLVHPDASVAILEMRSQPVSVLGSVKSPGVYQIQGRKTLFELLSMAGGLNNDAGYQITITRNLKWGALPLPDTKTDSTGQFSLASVPVDEVLTGANPALNILVKPEDVISVPKGEVVYVLGAVLRPGGYVMNEKEVVSALEVLALAQGLDQTAKGNDAKVMRVVPGSIDRQEIAIKLSGILKGNESDMLLQPDDILFVPSSTLKTLGYGILRSTSNAAGSAIYRIP